MKNLINKYFILFAFVFTAGASISILFYGDSYRLFTVPYQGTDQLSMLKAAVGMYHGKMPAKDYFYSPSYTLMLYFLVLATNGKLIAIRILQALICALIPVFIYKLCLAIRMDRFSARISTLLYCFYGPAALMSLILLRAMPLSLCFILAVYFLVRAYTGKLWWKYLAAGIFAGLCILGRENFIPVVLAPLVMYLFKDVRKYAKFKFAAIYICGILIMLLPVVLYNYFKFDSFSIIPGHFDNVVGAYHGEKAVKDSGIVISSVLKNIPRQIYLFISSYELDNSVSYYAHRDLIPFMHIYIIPYNLILALAVVAFGWRFRERGILLISLFILAYASSMLFFELFYRFRLPIVPLLAVLSGAGLAKILKGRNILEWGAPVILVFLIFIFSGTNPNKLRRKSERFAVVKILIQNKKFDKADKYLNQMRKEGISTRQARLLLINTMYKNGKINEANIMYKKLIMDHPKTGNKAQVP